MRTATMAPASMVRVPSVMAVQWKATIRSSKRTTPTPRRSSNSATVPTNVALPTGSRSAEPFGSGGVTRVPSVHDLRQGQFDDVRSTPVAQFGNEHIDLRLTDHGLDGESTTTEEFGHGRRAE